MRLLIAALALSLAACSPMTDPGAGVGGSPQSAEAACAAQNGTMQRVGRLQTLQCIVRYADAGKQCTDGSQCEGDCRLPVGGATPASNATVTGVCQADSNNFGCHVSVENGKVGVGLCVD